MNGQKIPAPVGPPRQERSRASWSRVLSAGAALLEEGGFEAFTIAAVCDRAGVAAPSIYARAANKDALLLAVYEYAHAGMVAGERGLFEPLDRWAGLHISALVREATAELAETFLQHAAFRRAVILRSGMDSTIGRHASEYATSLGTRYKSLILTRRTEIIRKDPEQSIDVCFQLVFAALTMRVTYGANFSSARRVTDSEFIAEVAESAVQMLIAEATQ